MLLHARSRKHCLLLACLPANLPVWASRLHDHLSAPLPINLSLPEVLNPVFAFGSTENWTLTIIFMNEFCSPIAHYNQPIKKINTSVNIICYSGFWRLSWFKVVTVCCSQSFVSADYYTFSLTMSYLNQIKARLSVRPLFSWLPDSIDFSTV